MSTLNQELFLVRDVETGGYLPGYGRYSTPMLYTKGAAASVAGKRNKRAGCIKFIAVPVEVNEKREARG